MRNTNANDERACRGLLARELAGKIRRALDAGGDRDGRRPSPPWLRRWLASHDLCWLRQQLALGEDGLRQVHAEFASRREFRMATAPERAVIDALLDDASIETLRSAIRSGTLSGKTALDRAIVHQLLAIDRGSLGALALRCATNLIGSFGAVQPPPPRCVVVVPRCAACSSWERRSRPCTHATPSPTATTVATASTVRVGARQSGRVVRASNPCVGSGRDCPTANATADGVKRFGKAYVHAVVSTATCRSSRASASAVPAGRRPASRTRWTTSKAPALNSNASPMPTARLGSPPACQARRAPSEGGIVTVAFDMRTTKTSTPGA